jgi:hypothetical protein
MQMLLVPVTEVALVEGVLIETAKVLAVPVQELTEGVTVHVPEVAFAA